MRDTVFFRVLADNDKAETLEQAIHETSEGQVLDSTTFVADPASFGRIPGSTFAYWVNERIRNAFINFPRFAYEGRDAQSGASTMNDFRFLRLQWEIDASTSARNRAITFQSGRWVPFAKGGAFSLFYSDWELVIDWHRDGEILKQEVSNYRSSHGWGHQWTAAINGHSSYFLPGLTWSRRTTSNISVRILPQGCIFADKGPAAFAPQQQIPRLLALMNSRAFASLVALQLGAADAAARSYEVGLIEKTPVPDLSGLLGQKMGELAISCVNIKRTLDVTNEVSHFFCFPALSRTSKDTIKNNSSAWQTLVMNLNNHIVANQQKIDDIAYHIYGFSDSDRQILEIALKDKMRLVKTSILKVEEDDDIANPIKDANEHNLVVNLLSYAFGCPFGRWDIRFATGEKSAPALSDPFAPLPVCAPGMLIGEDGMPLREMPAGYPLDIKWDGILVDDPEHPDDLVRRVREVLSVIWQEQAEAIEQELCQILGLKDLREYFRRPGKGGFWDEHIQRYSKSRRKAPIYWLLQSEKRNYALWIYIQRLDKDLLFKALVNYVEPKLRLEESHLEQLRVNRKAEMESREGKRIDQQLERQENFLSELRDFRDKMRRATDLQLEPDLNDGVVLNLAPLWEMVPWNEAKKYWGELLAGKYEWSSIGQQLRARGKV